MNIQNLAFENTSIRSIVANGIKRVAAIDCCRALGYKNPRQDWNKIKNRNPELAEIVSVYKLTTDGVEQRFVNTTENKSGVTKLVTQGEQSHGIDTLELEGITNLCMIAKTEKAREFRRWARKVLAEKIEQTFQENIPIDVPYSYDYNNLSQVFKDILHTNAALHESVNQLSRRVYDLEAKATNKVDLEKSIDDYILFRVKEHCQILDELTSKFRKEDMETIYNAVKNHYNESLRDICRLFFDYEFEDALEHRVEPMVKTIIADHYHRSTALLT